MALRSSSNRASLIIVSTVLLVLATAILGTISWANQKSETLAVTVVQVNDMKDRLNVLVNEQTETLFLLRRIVEQNEELTHKLVQEGYYDGSRRKAELSDPTR